MAVPFAGDLGLFDSFKADAEGKVSKDEFIRYIKGNFHRLESKKHHAGKRWLSHLLQGLHEGLRDLENSTRIPAVSFEDAMFVFWELSHKHNGIKTLRDGKDTAATVGMQYLLNIAPNEHEAEAVDVSDGDKEEGGEQEMGMFSKLKCDSGGKANMHARLSLPRPFLTAAAVTDRFGAGTGCIG
jgi:hypothetical protein